MLGSLARNTFVRRYALLTADSRSYGILAAAANGTLSTTVSVTHSNESFRADARTLGSLRSYSRQSYSGAHSQTRNSGLFYSLVGAAAAGTGLYCYLKQETAKCKQQKYEPGSLRKGLPLYTTNDVKQHTTKEKRIWATYKNGVYDITEFIEHHPGGEKILLAAGGALDPYFQLFAQHQTQEVMEMVESMRIGNIEDVKIPKAKDAFEKDPDRSPVLRINSAKPFNAEPPQQLLSDSFITPTPLFFVRNHMPVPQVDKKMAANYKLEACVDKKISGANHRSGNLPIDAIKRLPKVTLPVTLMCAGNRRREMSTVKTVNGLMWDAGSIGTATWSGARLIDVLHAMGFKDEDLKHQYIQFEGLDIDPSGTPYGSSIPMELALDPRRQILVAYEMNGEPISEDHGYPLRVIMPGIVGARNVKWLKRIVVADEESHSHWQRKDYKTFSPSTEVKTADFGAAHSIADLPVQSAICQPLPNSTVDPSDEYITVRGYAYSGGGRGIFRVDLSIDGGKTWINPELDSNGQSVYSSWAWTLWEAIVPIPKGHKGPLEIVCKAVDSSHNTQADTIEGIWNFRGLLNNSWHRITVNVQ